MKVGAINFDIHFIADLDELGFCDLSRQRIDIERNMAPEMQLQALIHEMLHAININVDESEIVSLAVGLTQVLLENAEFRNFISAVASGTIDNNDLSQDLRSVALSDPHGGVRFKNLDTAFRKMAGLSRLVRDEGE